MMTTMSFGSELVVPGGELAVPPAAVDLVLDLAGADSTFTSTLRTVPWCPAGPAAHRRRQAGDQGAPRCIEGADLALRGGALRGGGISVAGTDGSAARDAGVSQAAVEKGLEQANQRAGAASAIGTFDGVPALLRRTTNPRVQPESGHLGEGAILVGHRRSRRRAGRLDHLEPP